MYTNDNQFYLIIWIDISPSNFILFCLHLNKTLRIAYQTLLFAIDWLLLRNTSFLKSEAIMERTA